MNQEQYESLCDACDRALLAEESGKDVVAIPWLHVLREHPVVLAAYEGLFREPAGPEASRSWSRILRARASWLRQIGIALRSESRPWFGLATLPQRVDILFVSHLLNISHAGMVDDFYFDKLPGILAARGHSVVIALINHTYRRGAPLADKWKGSAVDRVVLSDSLGLAGEVALHRRMSAEASRLRQRAKEQSPGLLRRVLDRASQEAVSGATRTTLRLGEQIAALAVALKPKAIVVTHEGHAWERIVFAGARSAVPDVRCVGYQHAALFRLQHAIQRGLAPAYNPDHILTSGPVFKARLDRAPGLRGVSISVLGSSRGVAQDASAGVVAAKVRPRITSEPNRQGCLVLPEGMLSECDFLFGFSLECARAFPDVRFIWRLHPLVAFESLMARNAKLQKVPDNVVLSDAPLETDIMRARWALYRGTTAIVQAVGAGVRPLYLRLPGEMTIDPLYELAGWRIAVTTPEDVRRVVDADRGNPYWDGEAAFVAAERHCRNMFTPLSLDALTDAAYAAA